MLQSTTKCVPACMGNGTVTDILAWLLGQATSQYTEARHASMELCHTLCTRARVPLRSVLESKFSGQIEVFLAKAEYRLEGVDEMAPLTVHSAQNFQVLFEVYFWLLGGCGL